MPENAQSGQPPNPRGAPGVIAPTNRINVALPFSKIQTHEPSRELGELAAVVAELAALVEAMKPDGRTKRLREHAQKLAEQLGSDPAAGAR